jgi:tetratricopeptide (TPR) repeat protein
MRIGITILIFFIFNLICESQNAVSCLSESQLLNLQALPYNSINNFLNREGWSRNTEHIDQTSRYFGYDLNYSVAVWENRTTEFFEGRLYLYYHKDKPNILVYHAINECFVSILNVQPPRRGSDSTTYTSYIFSKNNGRIFDFRDYKNDISPARFSILIYDKSSVNDEIMRIVTFKYILEGAGNKYQEGSFEEAIHKYENARKMLVQGEKNYLNQTNFISLQIQKCKENINRILIENIVAQGDRYFELKEFETALDTYRQALSDFKSIPSNFTSGSVIENRIQNCKENINRVLIQNFVAEGDTLFRQDEFDTALRRYEQAMSYFDSIPSNFETGINIENKIKGKIDSARYLIGVIKMRKTPQKYSSLNPSGFEIFMGNNLKFINSMIYNFKRSGNINFKSVINFDTLGTNISKKEIESYSSNRIKTFVENNLYTCNDLSPIRIDKYYIPVIEEIPFQITWNSYPLSAKARSSRIKINPANSRNSDFKNNIDSFINNQNFKNGVYMFEIIDKTINETRLNDVSLTRYRNNSGPLKSIYSLFLPGWGTRKVTNGEKGGGRISLFLLSTAICIGSKIYSDLEYDKYLETSSGRDAGEHYDVANTANKVFLISGGIAATIYIHDFFWVLGKGIKNNNQSKALREKLKTGPIKIIESPMKSY